MDITEALRLLHKINGGKAPLAKEAEQNEHDEVFEKLDAVPRINDAKPKRKTSILTRDSNLTQTSS